MVHYEHHLTSLEEAKQHYEYYKDRLREIYSTAHCSQTEVVETENEMNYWRDEYQGYKSLSI